MCTLKFHIVVINLLTSQYHLHPQNVQFLVRFNLISSILFSYVYFSFQFNKGVFRFFRDRILFASIKMNVLHVKNEQSSSPLFTFRKLASCLYPRQCFVNK